MMSPPSTVTNEEIVRAYDRLAPLYDRFVAPFEAGTRRRALDSLSVDAGGSVLELGCGPGHALAPLARLVGPTGRVVGLDAAPKMVEHARNRATQSAHRGEIEVVLGDARSLPIADGSIDLLFVEDTLELFTPDEIRTVLAECHRVLATDGQLVVLTMEREDAEDDTFVRTYEWVFDHVPGYEQVGCRPIYARNALEAARFEVEREEHHRRGYVWPVELLVASPTEQ